MDLINNKSELVSYLTTKQIASKAPPKTVMVTAAVRRKVLTDEMQGKFIQKGAVHRLDFEPMGGGVYKAFIKGPTKGYGRAK